MTGEPGPKIAKKRVELNTLVQIPNIDFSRYWESERDLIDPALQKLGYTQITKWYTSEGDSFGPLIRSCTWKKDGEYILVWYG